MAELADLSDVLKSHDIAPSSLRVLAETGGGPGCFYLEVPGDEAVARWSALRNIVEETGYWPVLLGGQADLERRKQLIANLDARSSEQIIAEARVLDSQAWLRQRLDQFHLAQADVLEDLHEEWPADIEHEDTFSIPYDPDMAGFRATCYLALVPASASWQVPALLRFGDWTACPPPAEHASVLARWEFMYGAEIVGMTHDTLELTVGNPPTEPGEALDLAYEQLGYCEDLVLKGTLTIERLAATLRNGRVWFFWWA